VKEINYIIALDLSLSNTGVCVFDKEGNPIELLSISTDNKMLQQERLRIIGDKFLEIKKKYNIDIMILESGFSKFNISTQAIYRVHGIACYLFSDCEQKTYAPSTVKKIITGNGKSDKKIVQEHVKKIYPDLEIKNNDQSDACAIGICWLLENGIVKR
jgi:Holliday junction resolvasome RuvABC endonuclease subunit